MSSLKIYCDLLKHLERERERERERESIMPNLTTNLISQIHHK